MENILKESKEFRILFKKSLNLLTGRYSSKIKGDGIEFVDLKEYQAGDDIRKIDWKVTARENKPFIKEFLEEKDASHFVLLDISASMKNKLFPAKVLATSLLLSSNKARDSFSIGFFNSDEIILFPQSKSKNQLMRYVYEISQIKTQGKGDMKQLLLRVLNSISKKSIISIITDELELDSEVKSLITAVKQKHKLNYFQVYSSKEKNLEVGLNSFEDIETGVSGIYDLDENELKEYKEEFDRQINLVESDLLKIGVRPFVIDSDLDLNMQIRKRAEVI
ncbi:MAG: DUF58 domain-containing protein [Nanoarchaeota archaeon]|nr:DUF58 domain-containing protein [Nanoarchaeota archaeon]MCA9496868.1 DUF58 domain-containing protein [Nanoarchaeota archaeon]